MQTSPLRFGTIRIENSHKSDLPIITFYNAGTEANDAILLRIPEAIDPEGKPTANGGIICNQPLAAFDLTQYNPDRKKSNELTPTDLGPYTEASVKDQVTQALKQPHVLKILKRFTPLAAFVEKLAQSEDPLTDYKFQPGQHLIYLRA